MLGPTSFESIFAGWEPIGRGLPTAEMAETRLHKDARREQSLVPVPAGYGYHLKYRGRMVDSRTGLREFIKVGQKKPGEARRPR